VPTFDALLREVLDHPDEMVPRQILGDFLLDQPAAGDQIRGEFLHVQCRLAALADDHPDRPELERREAELLPGCPQRWARPFRRRGAKAWSFGRGLVEGLTLQAADFDRMADLLVREQPVQRLRLLGRGWAERLRNWPGLPRVRALDLDPNHYAADGLLRLQGLSGLREVSMPGWGWNNQLRGAPWMASLEALDLRPGNHGGHALRMLSAELPRLRALKTTVMAHASEMLPQLRELTLTGINLASFMEAARNRAALDSLTVEGGHFHPRTHELHDLLRLPALATLRRLEIRDVALKDATALAALLGRGRLARLTLHNVVVQHLQGLADSGSLGQLRELSVTRSRSTPLSLPAGHVEALAAADLGSLTSLSLCGYDLKMNDLLDLLAAPWLDRLHSLTLRECNLNPHVVSVFLRGDWPRLAKLDLRGNWLDRGSCEALRRRFGVKVRYSIAPG
jgi:uncharacterized protein (TIGR02996 family)